VAEAVVAEGVLNRPDGARLYWERYGAGPAPALYLHGGPGSGLGTHYRSYFHPSLNTVLAFDQRGCGRSVPSAADDLGSLRSNTTPALIEDIEALRDQMGVDRWLVVGLSWGATLALAYAQSHPERVSGLVLGAVTTTSRAEVEWITQDLRRVFPQKWEALARVAQPRPGERLVDALYRGITSTDRGVRERTAIAWSEWEDTHPSLDPNFSPSPRWQDPRKRLEVATLVLHYWSHHGFLGDAGVMDRVHRLEGMPGILIHGRLDLSSTISVPYDLQRAWPSSTLIEIEDEGHFGTRISRAVGDAVKELSTVEVPDP
jgi:proline iminopeptidase